MIESGDYISRADAIEAMYKDAERNPDHVFWVTQHLAIDNIPAADVRPVRRGKWIDHQEGRWIYAKCSVCGTVHDVKSNFCPNCGADMRGESDA